MFPAILIQVLIVLLVVGLILWAISQFPLDPQIAKVIRVVVIVAVPEVVLSIGLSGSTSCQVASSSSPNWR